MWLVLVHKRALLADAWVKKTGSGCRIVVEALAQHIQSMASSGRLWRKEATCRGPFVRRVTATNKRCFNLTTTRTQKYLCLSRLPAELGRVHPRPTLL